ncbi:unnamed protein product [Prunus armeniaca]
MIIFQRSLAFSRKPLATIGEKPQFFFKIPQISSIRSSIRPKPSLAESLGKVWSNFCGGIARQFPPLSTSASCWKNSIDSSGHLSRSGFHLISQTLGSNFGHRPLIWDFKRARGDILP